MNAPLCIEGRIVIDPRQRYTRSQERPVCHLHVLLTQREEAAPTVVEVILFDEDALRCSRDLKMGARVLIEGDAWRSDHDHGDSEEEEGANDAVVVFVTVTRLVFLDLENQQSA